MSPASELQRLESTAQLSAPKLSTFPQSNIQDPESSIRPSQPATCNLQPATDSHRSNAKPGSPRRGQTKAGPALAALPRRKVPQLPEKTRNSINVMIRNEVSLREISSHLLDSGIEINKDNLLRWKRTGYRQWLKDEQRREDAHAKIRFLLGLVQEKKNSKILRATQQIAALQVADILTTLDHQSLRKSIQDDPAQYTRLLNALPRLAEAGLACERLTAEVAASRQPKLEGGGLSPETLRAIEEQASLL